RRVAARRPRLQEEPLLAVKAVARALARRAVPPHVSHALEPQLPLVIEIGIVEKRATVHEIPAQGADRPLDLAFRLRPIGPARPWREAPVTREPEKLAIVDKRAAFEA